MAAEVAIYLSFDDMGETDAETALSWLAALPATDKGLGLVLGFRAKLQTRIEAAVKDLLEEYAGDMADYPKVSGWGWNPRPSRGRND